MLGKRVLQLEDVVISDRGMSSRDDQVFSLEE